MPDRPKQVAASEPESTGGEPNLPLGTGAKMLTGSLADTIVARATAQGAGAIAIVRLSGPDALEMLRVIAPGAKKRRSHELRPATLKDRAGAVLDKGLVVEMLQPNSYTGEDVVEFHLHGSEAAVHRLIGRVIELGGRVADPGEFTLRAFLNEKMSLAEAEAVADMVVSCSEAQRSVAARHVVGEFSALITGLEQGLEELLAELTAACDFPDDVCLDSLRPEQVSLLNDTRDQLQRLVDNAKTHLYEPRNVVLCGAPNAGKSTLANGLAGEKRVLVDELPGTTRDPVEIRIQEQGGNWLLVDTAGIRAEADRLEAQGVEMSLDRIRRADVSVWLVDPLNPVWPNSDVKVDFIVGSKSDLTDETVRARIEREAELHGFGVQGWMSGVEYENETTLRAELSSLFESPAGNEELVVVRVRHLEALKEAEAAIGRALHGTRGEMPLDVIAMELEIAARALGRILGRAVDPAILERIFATFCIGK